MKKFIVSLLLVGACAGISTATVLFIGSCGKATYTIDVDEIDQEECSEDYSSWYRDLNYLLCGDDSDNYDIIR
ncbi:MAG: hypothetical protein NC212_06885 [Staphylococcus sp.]|nr:hypothetical protein [Staphylococcus sp.]